jgi:hypothetical protein
MVDLFWQMVMSTKVNGEKTKHTGMVYIITQMGLNMRANGEMISKRG